MNNLSVVHIAPEQYAADINALGASYGVGDNSLSVRLVDGGGGVWWGCHAQWDPDDYLVFKSDPIPPGYATALGALYERVVVDGYGRDNFDAAIAKLNLREEP